MDGVNQQHHMDDQVNNMNVNSCARFKLETDETSHCYRRHFFGRVGFLNSTHGELSEKYPQAYIPKKKFWLVGGLKRPESAFF